MKRRKANERATKRIEGGKMMQLMSRFAVATIFFFLVAKRGQLVGHEKEDELVFRTPALCAICSALLWSTSWTLPSLTAPHLSFPRYHLSLRKFISKQEY